VAYRLLKTADEDSPENSEPLPRIVAIFGDRTMNRWDTNQHDDLKALREGLPGPAPAHLYFDLGVEQPANIAIVSLEMKPQRISSANDAVVNVALRADGVPTDATGAVSVKLLHSVDGGPVQERIVALAPGVVKVEAINFGVQPVGLHTVTFKVDREDPLPFDNEKHLSFEVGQPRPILTITDSPETALAWELAHLQKGDFTCTVKTPARDLELSKYVAVTLLDVAEPTAELAKQLGDYVRSGGNLVIIPDGPQSTSERAAVYNSVLAELRPAALKDITVWDVPNKDTSREFGVAWKIDDDVDLRHPLLAPLREWKRKGNVDIFNPKLRRLAVRYRTVDPVLPAESTVVAYFDDADTERSPALIERQVGQGKVLLLTTRFDFDAGEARRYWNNYAKYGHSWPIVLPWLMMSHLCGRAEDVTLNFTAGSDVLVPLPPSTSGLPRTLKYEGPGIGTEDGTIAIGVQQSELRLSDTRTRNHGTYRVSLDGAQPPWQYQFSLNTAASASDLTRTPVESITDFLGPNSLADLDRKVDLSSLVEQRLNQQWELFPWLLLLMFVFIVLEGIVANRFYRRSAAPSTA
jgi:hypothetical protein